LHYRLTDEEEEVCLSSLESFLETLEVLPWIIASWLIVRISLVQLNLDAFSHTIYTSILSHQMSMLEIPHLHHLTFWTDLEWMA
jgi:hypothetical protein